MSQEPDSSNAAQASSSPKKKPKPNTIPKLDNEAIDERRKQVIDRVPDSVNKETQLYKNVVEIINKTSLRRTWTETNLYKGFMHWAEFAEPNDHPRLEYMIATRAVHDSFEVRNPKFLLEIAKRGLQDWVNEQLGIPAQTATSSKPTAPEAQQTAPQSQQQTPKIKTEPGSRSANLSTIRQSIEGDNGLTPATGVKRPAPSSSSEPINKRANFGTDQALGTPKSTVPMLQIPQQRIVFREAGTQTDQTLAIEEASREMRMTTAENKERGRKMDEQFEMLRDLTGMLNNYRGSGSSQLTQARPTINSVQQQAFQFPAQEVFSVQRSSTTIESGSRFGEQEWMGW
ncbi:uncharacterized protein B0J16DRAFT_342936 [Fusarium flagelliforme]|uniref:uncharacterized protein n=1 Tax=Fusarium flagelliforme TaxID=2675880 RepID=UPI001E8D992E|nr:uncharacterized protein B0J16DRAFT_342936 [Fusarium flagelliforme]KAH7185923.1 hypothetical protein B0J16DRAFT_342936 [Fusarium flagelliforme]